MDKKIVWKKTRLKLVSSWDREKKTIFFTFEKCLNHWLKITSESFWIVLNHALNNFDSLLYLFVTFSSFWITFSSFWITLESFLNHFWIDFNPSSFSNRFLIILIHFWNSFESVLHLFELCLNHYRKLFLITTTTKVYVPRVAIFAA